MSGFRMRRGSSSAWTAANPVLGQGEFGYDLNASMFKIGNGVSSWTQLPYYSSGGGAADGFNRLAAGTQTAGTNTTVVFANSNGLTFGMSGSSQITASHNGLTTARASNDGVGLNTAGTNVTWTVNSAGLSLNAGGYAGTTSGFAGNLISGSMTHNTAGLNLSLNHPAWLTTAAQSNHSHGNPTLALTNLSGTTASNSNGLTLSLSAAAGGGGADGYNILAAGTQTAGTATTVNFADSNGISFGMSGNSRITASHNGIQQLAFSAGSGGITLTARTATIYNQPPLEFVSIGPNEVQLSIAPMSYFAVGNTTQSSSGTRNANLMTVRGEGAASVGVSGGSVVISAPTQSVQTQNLVSVQGSTGNISFSNSNGITFGFNNSTITASHNGLTTARASNDGVGLNTALTAGPLAWTVNSNGISLNAGSAAGTTSGFAGNLISGSMTHNTAGLNLSLNHPAWLTTAAQSNHSHGNPTLALTNLSGTTASNSNGLTLSLSAAAPGGGGGAALSAGTQSANTGTVVFANSNRVSFGMSGSSQITASVPLAVTELLVSGSAITPAANGQLAIHGAGGIQFAAGASNFTISAVTTYAASNHSHGNPTLALTNLSGTTASNSNGLTLSLSAAAPGAAAENNWHNLLGANTAGNTTASGSTIGLSGVNLTLSGTNGSQIVVSAPATSSLVGVGGISLSTNGSTISISYTGGGGGGGTATLWQPFNEGVNVAGQVGNASLHIVPLPTPVPAALGELQVDRLCIPLIVTNATNSTGTVTISHSLGLYTRGTGTQNTRLSLAYSTSTSLAVTFSGTVNNSTYAGIRLLTVPWTTTINDGRYYVAQWSRTTTGGANASASQMLVSQLNSNFSGIFGVNSNRSNQWPLGYGVFSASITTAMPASIAFSQIDGTASLAARPPSFFMISGTA